MIKSFSIKDPEHYGSAILSYTEMNSHLELLRPLLFPVSIMRRSGLLKSKQCQKTCRQMEYCICERKEGPKEQKVLRELAV